VTKSDTSSETEAAPAEAKRPQDWSPKERIQLLLESDGLGEQELGELLRRRGVHREQLDGWRAALDEAFAHPSPPRRSAEAKRIKQLERELARKDKALAETAALLVLQKKLKLLFPAEQADEDDDTDERTDR
jgi:transposase